MIDPPSSTRIFASAVLARQILVREWTPVGLPNTAPTALIIHGLGDHSARHRWAAGLLGKAGIRSVGFDWPGNGGSDGVRGDMPTVEESAALLGELLAAFEVAPVGIFAHSTGAFLVLSWLARQSEANRALGGLRWIWLSSPLIRPSHRQSAIKIAVARALARRFPRMTLSNGVHARDCYHTGFSLAAESQFAHDGGHHRVSLRFATSLLEAEGGILRAASEIPRDLACLVTQGLEDRICPPIYAEALFRHLPGTDKTCLFVSGSRHEPFREPEPESFYLSVRSWIDRVSRDLSGRGFDRSH